MRLHISEGIRRQLFYCLLIDGRGADRISIADALSHGNHVRDNIIVLVPKPLSGPADAGGDLVANDFAIVFTDDGDDVLDQGFGWKTHKARRAAAAASTIALL